MEITLQPSLDEKLHILADAAKYDVACTSSGVDRKGKKGYLGNSRACGICHSFASDGRCISLLKILMSNHCVYDCKFCLSRCSNDVPRATFTPQEICELTVEFYKRNYIEGLFLSSAIIDSPRYTMEKICETVYLLRAVYRFNGYIHIKAVPGAPDEMLMRAGCLADRMSINLEFPTEETLRKLAPNKSHRTILKPMGMLTSCIAKNRLALGKSPRMERSYGNQFLRNSIFSEKNLNKLNKKENHYLEDFSSGHDITGSHLSEEHFMDNPPAELKKLSRPFASAGLSTQMIIGAGGDSDYTLLKTTQLLYQKYDLKRVFYSAYVPINDDSSLPPLGTLPPLLREHRLYQADWLLRYYGFQAEELLNPKVPNFNLQIDPKCNWALRHIGYFPIEINHASYEEILRVPGIGPKSASRIVRARKYGLLDFPHIKKMGVVLKRAQYFITCKGKMLYKIPMKEDFILRQLVSSESVGNEKIREQNQYRQLNLFDDFNVKR